MVCLFLLLNSKLLHFRQILRIHFWLSEDLRIDLWTVDLICLVQKCFDILIKNFWIELLKTDFWNTFTIGRTPQFSKSFTLVHYLKIICVNYHPYILIQLHSLILFSSTPFFIILVLRFHQNTQILFSSKHINKNIKIINQNTKTIFEPICKTLQVKNSNSANRIEDYFICLNVWAIKFSYFNRVFQKIRLQTHCLQVLEIWSCLFKINSNIWTNLENKIICLFIIKV